MVYNVKTQKTVKDLYKAMKDELEEYRPDLEEMLDEKHTYSLLFSLKEFYKNEYMEEIE